MDIVMQLATAFTGSLGYGLVFHVRRERLLPASLGGLLCWAVYLAMEAAGAQAVPRYFVASVVVTIYAEALARVAKCPATTFLIPGAIPLIPGGSLYQTMSYFMAQDMAACTGQAFVTVVYAMAIAVGMLCPMSVFQLIRRTRVLLAGEKTRKKG